MHTLHLRQRKLCQERCQVFANHVPSGRILWEQIRPILLASFAAHGLRSMHAFGILDMLIPEFHGIDALVIRDAYHRYTVDEHTFLTIDHLHRLEDPGALWGKEFANLYSELERPIFYCSPFCYTTWARGEMMVSTLAAARKWRRRCWIASNSHRKNATWCCN